jgi:type I pantothenate kinase
MSDVSRIVASLVEVPADATRPVLIGIAGGVAVGKSVAADEVRGELPGRVDVVGTDGFLFPNGVLAQRGLVHRKGFPESYDVDALRSFLTAARAGALPRPVPCYSHVTYDVVGERLVAALDVLIVEGLNVLAAAADLLDVAVYLDASEEQLEAWYTARFLELVAEARDDPSSFYRTFADLDADQAAELANQVWRGVNLVNLRDHVAPSRARAGCVITKGAHHEVVAVEYQPHLATETERS